MESKGITPLTDGNVLAEMLRLADAVLFKHSPRCPVSAVAHDEIRSFATGSLQVPVYMVDVVNQRPLSQKVAATLGIPHESPQVIILRQGEPVWDASHYNITASALERFFMQKL